jgi:hypothetical protein
LGLPARPLPTQWFAGHVGPLRAETRRFISGLDPALIARTLGRGGAEPRQVAHALRRLEHLKRDPSFLEIKDDSDAAMQDMLARVAAAGAERNQGLSQETIDHINEIIAATLR